MPNRRRGALDAQMELSFPDQEETSPATVAQVGSLVDLHCAVRLLVDVAEGRVARSAVALDGVRASLGVVAAHAPRGRLGHVVRRYLAHPAKGFCWDELADELAFVLSLTPDEETVPPTRIQGGPP